MTIHKTREFIDGLEGLPFKIRKLYKKQEGIFKRNWLYPRLHIKRLKEFFRGIFIQSHQAL